MRPQKVGVDVWKMVLGSCSYLALAFAAWVLLKLVNACFWLPQHLRDQDKLLEVAEEAAGGNGGEKGEKEAAAEETPGEEGGAEDKKTV